MGKIKTVKKPGKKWIAAIIALTITTVTVICVLVVTDKGQNIDFRELSEKEFPQEISSEVIPEYRDLERALACLIDEKVYVIVTRGEKPASGYKVDIDKMKLETDNGKETLVVYATFRDPAKTDSMSQVLTYPLKVAEIQMKTLPDEIELRVQYGE